MSVCIQSSVELLKHTYCSIFCDAQQINIVIPIKIKIPAAKLAAVETELEALQKEREEITERTQRAREELAGLKTDLQKYERAFDEIFRVHGTFRYLEARTDVGLCPPSGSWTPFKGTANNNTPFKGAGAANDTTPFGRRPVLRNSVLRRSDSVA